MAKSAGRRKWVWWLKWPIASFGLAVVQVMLLNLAFLPFGATDVFLGNRAVFMSTFLAVGAVISYRYLK